MMRCSLMFKEQLLTSLYLFHIYSTFKCHVSITNYPIEDEVESFVFLSVDFLKIRLTSLQLAYANSFSRNIACRTTSVYTSNKDLPTLK